MNGPNRCTLLAQTLEFIAAERSARVQDDFSAPFAALGHVLRTRRESGVRHAKPCYRLIELGEIELLRRGVDFLGHFNRLGDARVSSDDGIHTVVRTLQLRGQRRTKTAWTYDA